MKMMTSFIPAIALLMTAGCDTSGDSNGNDASETTQSRGVDVTSISSDDLKSAVSDDLAKQFYEQRDWKAAWTDDAANGLMTALGSAARHGLDPADYLDPVRQAEGDVAREAAMTEAAIMLASALGQGRSNPKELFDVYTLPRPQIDPAAQLNAALSEGRFAEWIASLPPSDAEYEALSKAYIANAERAERGEAPTIGEGDVIEAGDTDPRVPNIAKRLQSEGYLTGQKTPDERQSPETGGEGNGDGTGADSGNDPNVYTNAMADAVKQVQKAFGIKQDGVVGPKTIAVLNIGPSEKARLLAVNLERRRWLRRDTPATRIDVNIADAMLEFHDEGTLRDRRRVVVGQPGWETPQLGTEFYRLVANPTWTVPKSIEKEEIEPKPAGYLAQNNMVRRDGWIVQQPGPDNALGEVKFDLLNDQAIYLHDTPAVSLFQREQRHLSHGCIRVNDALQFARMIASEAGVASDYRSAKRTGEETFVDVENNIPVRLLYLTAFATPSGEIRYRTDPYGWDEPVAEALGYEKRQLVRVARHNSDLAP